MNPSETMSRRKSGSITPLSAFRTVSGVMVDFELTMRVATAPAFG
jgi:hypothetical protein